MRALHDQARERGVRRVWLEVVDRNVGALALYEKLGYRTVRDVEVWSLPAKGGPSEAREVPAAEAQARIGTLGAGREWFKPWRTVTGRDDAPPNLAELQVLLDALAADYMLRSQVVAAIAHGRPSPTRPAPSRSSLQGRAAAFSVL